MPPTRGCRRFVVTSLSFNHRVIKMANWSLIAEIETEYTPEHIAWLLRKGKVKGRKAGGVWLVDADDMVRYEKEMAEAGTAKHDPKKEVERG